MSSWTDCIDRALTAKKIKGKKADEARERYANLYKEALADGMDERTAQDHAADMATQTIEAEKAGAKKRKLYQMRHSIDSWHTLNKGGPTKMMKNAKALFDLEPGATPGIISYQARVDNNRGWYQRLLDGLIDKYSPKFLGLHMPKAGLDNIVRELFAPGTTGDAMAAGIAKAWKETTDFAVRRFNQAGGVLNNLETWLLPQHQSRIRLYKAGLEQWKADHMGWLDWSKMRYPDGSRIPFADRGKVLDKVYATLKTGGDANITPGKSGGRGASVGNKFDAHRFLIFKNSDSWLAMHAKYMDSASIYETLMTHLDGLARDTAMIQSFGPNPSIGVEQIADHLRKIAAGADLKQEKLPRAHGVVPTSYHDEATAAVNRLNDTFHVVTRRNAAPENGSASIAAGLMQSTSTITNSALLGSIFVWAPQDFSNSAFVSRFAGLSVFDTMRWYFRFMNPANKADKAVMMRHGFINEAQTRFAHGHVRITGMEAGGSRFARRVSDFIMRAGTTSAHTQASRFATAAEFVGALADWKDMQFDQVPLKRVFEAHGITPDDWNKMRATPTFTERGHTFLMPDDYVKHSGLGEAEGYKLADKFMTMIQDEAKMATIEGSINSGVTLRGTARSGTLPGEILNSVSTFRSFMLTAANWHIGRGLTMNTGGSRLAWVGGWMTAMAISGAIGLQLQQVLKGRDPLSVFDGNFMFRSALAGGGFSIFGDLFSGDLVGSGIDLGGVIAGPPIEFLSDTINLTVGNLAQAIAGKDTHFAKELVQYASQWTPGTSLWYARRAIQAAVWENLLRWADPHAEANFRKQTNSLKRRTGQGSWWAPGDALPSRLPAVSGVVR